MKYLKIATTLMLAVVVTSFTAFGASSKSTGTRTQAKAHHTGIVGKQLLQSNQTLSKFVPAPSTDVVQGKGRQAKALTQGKMEQIGWEQEQNYYQSEQREFVKNTSKKVPLTMVSGNPRLLGLSLSGTYHVGAGKDFGTLHEMATALNYGSMSGAVTMLLDDATYTETGFSIGSTTGSSAVNTLTIQPNTGNAPTINVSDNSGGISFNGATYVTVEGTAVGASAGTRSLTISGSGSWSSSHGVVAIHDAASNVTISDVSINGHYTLTGAPYGVYLYHTVGSPSANVTVNNCGITNVSAGVYSSSVNWNGTDAVAGYITANSDQNITVTKCQIGGDELGGNVTNYGVRLENVITATIANNKIKGIIYPSGFSGSVNRIHGIRAQGRKFYIHDNVVDDIRNDNAGLAGLAGRVYGMRVLSLAGFLGTGGSPSGGIGDPAAPALINLNASGLRPTTDRIINNTISNMLTQETDGGGSATNLGIELYGTSRDTVAQNTVSIKGDETGLGGYFWDTGFRGYSTGVWSSAAHLFGNVFDCDRLNTYATSDLYTVDGPSVMIFAATDNNVYFTPSIPNGGIVCYSTAFGEFDNLLQYHNGYTAGGTIESKSVSGNPNATSASDLHITDGASSSAYQESDTAFGSGATLALVHVAKDLDGNTRSYPPSAGAYEVTGVGTAAHDVAALSLDNPGGSGAPQGLPFTGIAASIVNQSRYAETSVPVKVQLFSPTNNTNTPDQTFNGTAATLAWGGSAQVTFAGTWTPSIAGAWTFRVIVGLVTDVNHSNDTLVQTIPVAGSATIPYSTGFESDLDNTGWFGDGDFQIGSNDGLYGTQSTKLGGAHGGDAEWVTNPGAPGTLYSSNKVSHLYSPYFDLTSAASGVVSFYHSLQCEPGWDQSIFQYSNDTGRTWHTLGGLNDAKGINWYSTQVYHNAAATLGAAGSTSNGPFDSVTAITLGYPSDHPGVEVDRWTSNGNMGTPSFNPAFGDETTPQGPDGYVFVSYDLTGAGAAILGHNFIRFRYTSFSDFSGTYDGWAVDDWSLTATPASFPNKPFSGTLYTDTDGDGSNDHGESGLAATKVYFSYFGVTIDSVTSGGGGSYAFSMGKPGTYGAFVTTAGFVMTQKASWNHIGAGDSTTTANIGIYQGSISGKVFDDLNNLGTDQPANAGRSGWAITLHKDSVAGAVAGTATSDVNGAWSVTTGPGSYYAVETAQAGFRQTFPASNGASHKSVSGNSGSGTALATGADFGDFQLGHTVIKLTVDQNGDGVQQAGDTLLGFPAGPSGVIVLSKGATVIARDTLGNAQTSVLTVTGLDTGSYSETYSIINAGSPNPFITTGPTTGNFTISTSNQGVEKIYTGYGTHSLSGTVYNDVNGDGNKQGGDAGVQGWVLSYDGTGGHNDTSDVAGHYEFDGVVGGAHHVTMTVQAGYTKTAGGYTDSGNTTQHNLTGNFGTFHNTIVGGTVYRDLNGDGHMNGGDAGVSGITVNLGASHTTTGVGGAFSFANVGPGTQTLGITTPSGYTVSSDSVTYSVSPSSGTPVSDNFGIFKSSDGTMYRTFTAATLATHFGDKAAKAAKAGKPATIPTYANVLASLATNGVTLGYAGPNNAPYIFAKKFGDIMLSIADKTGSQVGQTSHGFDLSIKGKLLAKVYKNIGPKTQLNGLTGDMMALAINIALSDAGTTPGGLADSAIIATGDYAGMSVRQFLNAADTLMSSWHGVPFSTYNGLDSVAAQINAAFSDGTLDAGTDYDTSGTGWAVGSAVVKMTGVATIGSTGILTTHAGLAPGTHRTHVVPTAYALYQNFPNPFNPLTTIRFDLPATANVTLKLYNMLGQEVQTVLSNQTMSAGTFEFRVDGSNLSSGVYFYTLNANGVSQNGAPAKNFHQVLKMALVK